MAFAQSSRFWEVLRRCPLPGILRRGRTYGVKARFVRVDYRRLAVQWVVVVALVGVVMLLPSNRGRP